MNGLDSMCVFISRSSPRGVEPLNYDRGRGRHGGRREGGLTLGESDIKSVASGAKGEKERSSCKLNGWWSARMSFKRKTWVRSEKRGGRERRFSMRKEVSRDRVYGVFRVEFIVQEGWQPNSPAQRGGAHRGKRNKKQS